MRYSSIIAYFKEWLIPFYSQLGLRDNAMAQSHAKGSTFVKGATYDKHRLRLLVWQVKGLATGASNHNSGEHVTW